MTKFFPVPTKICESILLDILKGACEEAWRNDKNSPKQWKHNITKITLIHLENNAQTKTMFCLFQKNLHNKLCGSNNATSDILKLIIGWRADLISSNADFSKSKFIEDGVSESNIPIINLTIKKQAVIKTMTQLGQHGVAISTLNIYTLKLNNHQSIYLKINLHVNGFLCYKKNTISRLLRLSYNAKPQATTAKH